jgi:polar amino acid transport system substrate-binding protein
MKNFFLIFFIILLSLNSKIIYAESLDEINKRGALRICALADRLPFTSRNTSIKGFQIELAEEIAKELKVDLEITWLRYRFHARKAGCDMMMEAVSRKDDNENKRDIEGAKPLTRASDNEKKKFPPTASIPIVRMETYLVGTDQLVNGKNTLESIKDMNIGVMRGTWAHMLMQKAKIKYRTKYVTEAELIQGVADGEVDAVFISSPQYWWFLKNNPSISLAAVRDFNFTRDVSLNVGVLLRGADEITVNKINSILRDLLDKNVIQNIYSSYGIEYVAPK